MSWSHDDYHDRGAARRRTRAAQAPKPSGLTRFTRLFTRSSWSAIAILASLAISIVSFKTTFNGMADYLGGETALDLALSFMLTFGVQSLLFIVSWLIAFALFERHMLQAISFLGIFMISMAVSVAFSFVDLYDGRSQAGDGVVEAQETGRISRATGLASETVISLQAMMAEKRVETIEAFQQEPAYRTLKQTAQSVRSAAATLPPGVTQGFDDQLAGFRAERDALLAARNEATLAAAGIDQDMAQAQAQKAALEEELAAYREGNQANRTEAEAKIRELEPRVAVLSGQIANEIEGRGSINEGTVGQPGCGTVCRQLQAQLNPLQLDLEAARLLVGSMDAKEQEIQKAINVLETQMIGLENRRAELGLAASEAGRDEVSSDGASADRPNLNGPGGAPVGDGQAPTPANDRLAWLEKRISIYESGANPLEAIAGRMAANLDTFEKTQDFAAFNETVDLCRAVATVPGGEAVLGSGSAEAACPSAQDNPVFVSLLALNEQIAGFRAACGGGTEEGLAQILARQRSADEIFTIISQCIQQSGLRGPEIDALWRDLRNKMQRWSASASKTDKAYTALIEDGETAALTSLIIALVMDGLVLLVAIGGRQMQAVETLARDAGTDLFNDEMPSLIVSERDSDKARSIKTFLNGCHFAADGSGRINMDRLTAEEERSARSTLHMLMANKQAQVKDGDQPGIVTVTKAGHRRLVMLLQQETAIEAARTGPVRRQPYTTAQWKPEHWQPQDQTGTGSGQAADDPVFRGWSNGGGRARRRAALEPLVPAHLAPGPALAQGQEKVRQPVIGRPAPVVVATTEDGSSIGGSDRSGSAPVGEAARADAPDQSDDRFAEEAWSEPLRGDEPDSAHGMEAGKDEPRPEPPSEASPEDWDKRASNPHGVRRVDSPDSPLAKLFDKNS